MLFLRAGGLIFLGVGLLLTGCSRPQGGVPAASSPRASDPLVKLLATSEAGKTDSAIEILLNHQGDWLTENAPPEMRISESDLQWLSRQTRSEQIELMLQRASQLKQLARTATNRASELQTQGETEKAQAIVIAIQRLGQQLANADIALVLQLTGKALAGARLPTPQSKASS